MPKSQLTDEDRQRIVQAYESWTGSTESLAEHLGVGKQTIYTTLRRMGVEDKRTRNKSAVPASSIALADGMAREALTALIDELVRARMENSRLKSLLRQHGIEEAQA